uniref:Uncharacterized protein n=1 Tax=Heterorhabditis bacteriophora TaxID=37862 RepID=A0A1I7WGS6_HETBA
MAHLCIVASHAINGVALSLIKIFISIFDIHVRLFLFIHAWKYLFTSIAGISDNIIFLNVYFSGSFLGKLSCFNGRKDYSCRRRQRTNLNSGDGSIWNRKYEIYEYPCLLYCINSSSSSNNNNNNDNNDRDDIYLFI